MLYYVRIVTLKDDILETTELLIDEVFLTLLGHKSKQIIAKAAKAIAEIAKTERGREKCTNIELIRALIGLLKGDDINILTQTSRALGNICYENGNCNSHIYSNVHNLISLHIALLLLFLTMAQMMAKN